MQCLHHPGRGQPVMGYQVDKVKQAECDILIVIEVELTRMDCLVACDPHRIHSLLYERRKALRFQRSYIRVDVLARLSKVNAQLLDAESE